MMKNKGIATLLVVCVATMMLTACTSNNTTKKGELNPQSTENEEMKDSMEEGTKVDTNTSLNESEKTTEENLKAYEETSQAAMTEMMEDMKNIKRTKSAVVDFLNGMIPHHEAAVKMANSYLENGANEEQLQALAKNIIKAQEEEIRKMQTMVEDRTKNLQADEKNEEAYWKEYSKMLEEHTMATGDTSSDQGSASTKAGMTTDMSTGSGSDTKSESGTKSSTTSDTKSESATNSENGTKAGTTTDTNTESDHQSNPNIGSGPQSTISVDQAFAQGMIAHHKMAVQMAESIEKYTKDEEVLTLAKNIVKTQKEEINQMEDILDELNDKGTSQGSTQKK